MLFKFLKLTIVSVSLLFACASHSEILPLPSLNSTAESTDDHEAMRLFEHILNPPSPEVNLHYCDSYGPLTPSGYVRLTVFSETELPKEILDSRFWSVINKSRSNGIAPVAVRYVKKSPDGSSEYSYSVSAPRSLLLPGKELLNAANSGTAPMITNGYICGGERIEFTHLWIYGKASEFNKPENRRNLETLIANSGYRISTEHSDGDINDVLLVPADGIISREIPNPVKFLQLLGTQKFLDQVTINGFHIDALWNSFGVSN